MIRYLLLFILILSFSFAKAEAQFHIALHPFKISFTPNVARPKPTVWCYQLKGSAPCSYYIDSVKQKNNKCTTGYTTTKPAIPKFTEICNGIDDDCDGVIDNGIVMTTYWFDTDGDGYGDPNNSVVACSQPTGTVLNSSDYNDLDAAVHVPQVFYVDNDRDGVGSTAVFLCSSVAPVGYSMTTGDCNDFDATVTTPESLFIDADGDGYGSAPATLCSSVVPVHYSKIGGDPDDNNSYLTPNNVPNPSLHTLSITITDTTIAPIFCASWSNLENAGLVQGNPKLIAYLDSIHLTGLAYIMGSEAQWYHRWGINHTDGHGFNCDSNEIKYQHKAMCDATVITGGTRQDTLHVDGVIQNRCCQPTVAPFWKDFIFTLDTMNADFLFCPNVCAAYYDHFVTDLSLTPQKFPMSYDSIRSEWQSMMDDVHSIGQHTIFTQLGVEDQFYTNLFDVNGYATVCNDNMAWWQSHCDGSIISGDICGQPKWDNVASAIAGLGALRYYIAFTSDFTTWQSCLDIINNMQSTIQTHLSKYPTMKMSVVQTEFKNTNVFCKKVGEAVLTAAEYINEYHLNLQDNNTVNQLSLMNLSHLFDKNRNPYPLYYSFRFFNDFDHNQYCESSFSNSGVTTIASKKGNTIQVVIVNTSANDYNLEQITINGGTFAPTTIQNYFGQPSDRTFQSNHNLHVYPYSTCKIYLTLNN